MRRYVVGFRSIGLTGLPREFFHRTLHTHESAPGIENFLSRFDRLTALEIGGPSEIFSARGLIPIYSRLARCDNVDFATRTAWSHCHESRSPAVSYMEAEPRTFILEATSLPAISDSTYDVLLCSHVLEHVANPIKALHEWKRVLRAGGTLLVVVPNPARTFDHRRPVTQLRHMIRDFEADVGEDDSTHYDEILRLHDRWRDLGAGDKHDFATRVHQNVTWRTVHHHVFSEELLVELLQYVDFDVIWVRRCPPFHIASISVANTDTRD